ncbi:hypothetical protein V3C99_007933, partial [Haemonchus contortus]|uniref:ALO domain-containing protein n=1 Tax=Haemonchus contortus TaxID=6289 RepID=A0A7I4YLS3_HAECO
VRALWRPPVPQDHIAYEKCKEFLENLHSTWFDGPYKDNWNNHLNVVFGKDHPDMRTLMEKLKYIVFEAKRTLQ